MLIKKEYTFPDLKEMPLDEAPSLDMPHFIVDKFYMPSDGGKYMVFFAHVDKSYRPADECPYCHSQNIIRDGKATKPRLVHDVIRNNYRVDIVFYPPRMNCKSCDSPFTPNVKGISGSRMMTTRLEEFLRVECFLQPFTQLAERSGYSVGEISSIMDEELEKYDKMREEHPLEAPTVLGIDEKHLAHYMRGTLVDVGNRLLLDMFEDNKKPTIAKGIKKLKNWDKNIKVVTTDMNNAYIPMIKETLPNATIVIDKFHVVQDVEQSITKCRKLLISYRKDIIENIEDLKEKAEQAAILRIVTSNPKLFNANISKILNEKNGVRMEKLSTVIDAFPEFSMLHNLHYGIEHLYEQETREDAEKAWEEWSTLLPPSKPKAYQEWCAAYGMPEEAFDCFRKFNGSAFLFFKQYILNYFNSPETRFTNSTTEGFNSTIEDINIAGKGYEFRHLRGKCLYASLVHEKINYGLKIKTVKKWVETQSFSFVVGHGSRRPLGEYRYISEFSFNQAIESVSLPLPSIGRKNKWLDDILFEKVDPDQDRRDREIIADIRSMKRAGIKFITEYDRPEGDEFSITNAAEEYYDNRDSF